MITRTLLIENPVSLSVKHKQLVITNKEIGLQTPVPIEDIGVVIIDNKEVIITMHVIQEMSANNVAVVFCNSQHLPESMLLPLDSNSVQTERFRNQIEAGIPLKKQLWQQTIKNKIRNQASVLRITNKNEAPLHYMASQVKSGDITNEEAQASRYYWGVIFEEFKVSFRRERMGMPPNNLLNYGYTILRAAVARALTGSGLLPTLGIHHRNKYNAYCLADDIMEPYRAWVDIEVWRIMHDVPNYHVLTRELKTRLLKVLTHDVHFENKSSPLMVALSSTTSSLANCFAGSEKFIRYPSLLG
ncbi:MAG: type II CRISPR-associated endonuclease Cas1 [Bacteroidia bacterium]|nr:type II CRISPR-associated endonuclease Cas1 [Bacteroidia bacterium]